MASKSWLPAGLPALLLTLLLAGCSGGGDVGDAGIDADGDGGDGDQVLACIAIGDCPNYHLCLEGFCRLGTICRESGDCPQGFSCMILKEVCVPENPCGSDDDCQAPAPYCLTGSGVCVACREDGHCPGGYTCSADYTCEPPGPDCQSDADCGGDTPYCDQQAGKCFPCVSDGHCSGQVCEPASHQCVDCYQDGHCSGATPYCLTEAHLCVECRADGDCAGGLRCSQSHTCTDVVCTADADCAAQVSTPHCDTASGDCVQCTAHDHCGSFQWCRSFVCASGCQSDEECVLKQGEGYHCNTESGACFYAECMADGDCTSAETPYCLTQDNPAFNKCVACTADEHCAEFFYCQPGENTCAPTPCYRYTDPDAKCREVNSCYICDYGSGNCVPPTDQAGFSCNSGGGQCCPGYACNSQGHCEFDLYCDQDDPTCAEGYTCNFSYNQCEWQSCCQPPCGSGEFCNSDCVCESGCHVAGEGCDPLAQNCCPPLICNIFWPFCTGG